MCSHGLHSGILPESPDTPHGVLFVIVAARVAPNRQATVGRLPSRLVAMNCEEDKKCAANNVAKRTYDCDLSHQDLRPCHLARRGSRGRARRPRQDAAAG